ncbi:DUF4174 domain-containing protein [Agrobacterium larrymoorei]|nr:DUF4174 domain-containing protein [Agrobacterium larrymoorei]QYA09893.1 DUF4174 domain-containing protein [Agrobacterium larrymoorei]
MKHLIIAAALMLLAPTPGVSMESLSQFEWKNRVLVVFGDSGDPKIRSQLEAISTQKAELADRDMVVLHVDGGDVRAFFGEAGKLNAREIVAEASAPGDRFEAILVGKDGGIKLRSEDVVSAVELFDLVDRMPMRQSEQR